jgi:hypothetical protein
MTTVDPLAQFASTTAPTPSVLGQGVVDTEHRVLVGVMLMVIVLVILVEVAGANKSYAEATALLLLGPLLILGFNNSAKFASWVGNNPIQ